MKAKLIRLLFRMSFAIPLTRAAVYSRQPFPRWPYQYNPCQMEALSHLLTSVTVPGSVVEVGCNQGWTSAFLLEHMKHRGIARKFIGIDTFSGFLPDDVAVEKEQRGKTDRFNHFVTCKREWYEYSLKRWGYDVTAVQGDCGEVDYSQYGPIAFMLLDVDLYRPTLRALHRAWPHLANGGMIVVDDCDPTHDLWDGAHQAYREFCAGISAEPYIIEGKLGLISVASD